MATKWLEVKSALPGDMEDVLLFDELKGEYVGYYYATNGRFISSVDGYSLKNISHWMPLPARPEKNIEPLVSILAQADR